MQTHKCLGARKPKPEEETVCKDVGPDPGIDWGRVRKRCDGNLREEESREKGLPTEVSATENVRSANGCVERGARGEETWQPSISFLPLFEPHKNQGSREPGGTGWEAQKTQERKRTRRPCRK